MADVALVVLGAGFLAWLVSRGLRVGDQPNADFFDFYFGAVAVRDGQDLYRVNDGGYIYPPLLAVVLRPMTLLEPTTAAHVWTLVLAALLITTAWLVGDETQRRLGLGSSRVRTAAMASVAVVVLGQTWKSEFQWGNSNLLVLMGVVLGLRWVERRPAWSGAALGVAVGVKYLPIVLMPYLLVRRKWWAAGAFGVALGVALLGPAVVLGWERNLEYLGVAFRGLPEMAGLAERGSGANIHGVTSGFSLSVTSTVARWGERVGVGRAGVLLGTGVVACVLGVIGWWRYRVWGFGVLIGRGEASKEGERSERTLVLMEWSVLWSVALLFSPQTTHRHLNMLLPIVGLAVGLAVAERGGRRWALIGALVLATVGATAIPGVAGWRDATERWNQGGGAAACVAVLVLVTMEAGLAWARRWRA